MSKRHLRAKNRRTNESFVKLPHIIICSEEWSKLSPIAVKLLIDLYAQYKGHNNGDFTAAWSVLQPRGWNSKDTLYRAINELLMAGWIIRTRQGGRNKANLYAVTWQPIDECNGKLDTSATNRAPNTWKIT